MKLVIVAVLLMLCAVSAAYDRKPYGYSCFLNCYYRFIYIGHGYRSYRVCYYICPRKRLLGWKLSDTEAEIEVKAPCKFSDYDENDDGEISLKEFEEKLNLSETDHLDNTKAVFNSADADQSGGVDCKEFKDADWDFACTPTCD